MQAHPENTDPVFHLFEAKVADPDDFMSYMNDNGVEVNRHYPIPCHLQKAFSYLGYKKGDFPNAEDLAEHCVTLPLFPEMTEDEVSLVIDLCNGYKN
jgi:dTDP-4-amino-4,6-dideoxygalactose transaminase